MNTGEKSLRSLVEKWVGPIAAKPVRVCRFRSVGSNHACYVRVEAHGSSGSFAFFFFRHSDGSWCVFPPANEKPAMSAYRSAA
jgi:hypothetical protein